MADSKVLEDRVSETKALVVQAAMAVMEDTVDRALVGLVWAVGSEDLVLAVDLVDPVWVGSVDKASGGDKNSHSHSFIIQRD